MQPRGGFCGLNAWSPLSDDISVHSFFSLHPSFHHTDSTVQCNCQFWESPSLSLFLFVLCVFAFSEAECTLSEYVTNRMPICNGTTTYRLSILCLCCSKGWCARKGEWREIAQTRERICWETSMMNSGVDMFTHWSTRDTFWVCILPLSTSYVYSCTFPVCHDTSSSPSFISIASLCLSSVRVVARSSQFWSHRGPHRVRLNWMVGWARLLLHYLLILREEESEGRGHCNWNNSTDMFCVDYNVLISYISIMVMSFLLFCPHCDSTSRCCPLSIIIVLPYRCYACRLPPSKLQVLLFLSFFFLSFILLLCMPRVIVGRE